MSLVAKLRREIAEREVRIEELQAACTHPKPAVTKVLAQLGVLVHYDDGYGGQNSKETRRGFECSCGLCEASWREYEDGRLWTPFDQENGGRI